MTVGRRLPGRGSNIRKGSAARGTWSIERTEKGQCGWRAERRGRVGPTDPRGQQDKPHKAFLDPKHNYMKDKLIAPYGLFMPCSMPP